MSVVRRSAARKRRPIIVAPLVLSIFRSEICRENRRLQVELKVLEVLVGSIVGNTADISSRISGQEEIAKMFLGEMFKEKSEIYSKNDIILKNRRLKRELQIVRSKELALRGGIEKLIERVEKIGDRSPPRETNDDAKKILDEMLEEKSGDIHERVAVTVSEFCTATLIILTCYTSLCGVSLLCGVGKFFRVLVGGAIAALLWSCYYALHRVNKIGKEFHEVKNDQNQLPQEPVSDAHSQGEPSTWLILRFVWLDMLQVFLFTLLAILYLIHLAIHMHKEKCGSKLSPLVSSFLG